jgi:peptidoglycan/xylan/chitin deacetylase (PgdA/CDA1 family)
VIGQAGQPGRCINLTFHGIGDPDRDLGPGERDVWVSEQEFTAILDSVRDRADVRLSFDDGNASDVRYALPELRRRGLRATFFVVAGRLGKPGFLGAEDVRALVAAGMSIGCHGMAHRPWRKLDADEERDEMLVAREMIERVVGCPVREAACPFGAYDRRVLRALRRFGYGRVYTSDGGIAEPAGWLQPRNSVHSCNGDGGPGQQVGLAASREQMLLRHVKLAVKRWR